MAYEVRLDFIKQLMLIFLFTIILLLWRKKHKLSLINSLIIITFFCYIIKLISVVFFPFYIPLTEEMEKLLYQQNTSFPLNFIPFKSMIDSISTRNSWVQNGGNLLLLLPFGFYLSLLRKKIGNTKEVLLLSFIFSVTIEIIQGIMNIIVGYNYRLVDIDDVILNTLGSLIGYILFRITFYFVNTTTNIDNILFK